MKVRYLITHDTPLIWIPAGTVRDVTDEEALELLQSGMAEAVEDKAERAVKAPAKKAVKK